MNDSEGSHTTDEDVQDPLAGLSIPEEVENIDDGEILGDLFEDLLPDTGARGSYTSKQGDKPVQEQTAAESSETAKSPKPEPPQATQATTSADSTGDAKEVDVEEIDDDTRDEYAALAAQLKVEMREESKPTAQTEQAEAAKEKPQADSGFSAMFGEPEVSSESPEDAEEKIGEKPEQGDDLFEGIDAVLGASDGALADSDDSDASPESTDQPDEEVPQQGSASDVKPPGQNLPEIDDLLAALERRPSPPPVPAPAPVVDEEPAAELATEPESEPAETFLSMDSLPAVPEVQESDLDAIFGDLGRKPVAIPTPSAPEVVDLEKEVPEEIPLAATEPDSDIFVPATEDVEVADEGIEDALSAELQYIIESTDSHEDHTVSSVESAAAKEVDVAPQPEPPVEIDVDQLADQLLEDTFDELVGILQYAPESTPSPTGSLDIEDEFVVAEPEVVEEGDGPEATADLDDEFVIAEPEGDGPAVTADLEDEFVIAEPEGGGAAATADIEDEFVVATSDDAEENKPSIFAPYNEKKAREIQEIEGFEDGDVDAAIDRGLAVENFEPDATIDSGQTVDSFEHDTADLVASESSIDESILPSIKAKPTEPLVEESASLDDAYFAEMHRHEKNKKFRYRIIAIIMVLGLLALAGNWIFGDSGSGSVDDGSEEMVDSAVESEDGESSSTGTVEEEQDDQASVSSDGPTQSAPPAVSRPATAVASSGGAAWTVQVAAFESITAAARGRQEWEARGFEVVAWDYTRPSDGTKWYRIGAGRYHSRVKASEAAKMIKADYAIPWAPLRPVPR